MKVHSYAIATTVLVTCICLQSCFIFSPNKKPSYLVVRIDSTEKAILSGIIYLADKKTYPGVVISVPALKPVRGAVTKADGSFRIVGVPKGKHDIKILYLGYKQVILTDVDCTQENTLFFEELKEAGPTSIHHFP